MVTNLFNVSKRRLFAMLCMLMTTITSVQAEGYITEVMALGAKQGSGAALRAEYKKKGWTVLDNDLNRNAGGWDVYIAYKTSSTAKPETGYITDICASDKNVNSFVFEGRVYYKAPTNSGFGGDMNKEAGGAFIYIYYTRERYNLNSYGETKRVITSLSVSNSSNTNVSMEAPISWRNSKYNGLCDLNKGAGGDYIYLYQHFAVQTLKFKEEPVFATDLTYNGLELDLVTKDTWKANEDYGMLKYNVNDGSWSSYPPTAIHVGNYKVKAYLDGRSASGLVYANNSPTVSATVTINPPIVKAKDLVAVFNQGEKKVNLTWKEGDIPGYYKDFNWVVYRNGEKIATLDNYVQTYADGGYDNETSTTYDVYYVSKFWDENTTRDDTKATVTVSTVRSVPVNNLVVEQKDDRIIFTWNSDGYAEGFGNKFRIYVGNEEDPIYTLKASGMQTSFRWEHRSTDQHSNRQNKVDDETGTPYTEEPLNVCSPNDYRIEGVIGDVVLNTYTISPKAIGNGTLFYNLDASKGVYEGSVKLSWHVNAQGSVLAKTYIVERRRAEQEDEPWETLSRMSTTDAYLFYTDETALPGVYYDYRVTVEDKCEDGNIVNNEISNIGFAKCTGTVTGRIAFGSTGTAVKGVNVVMTMTNSEGEQTEQFHSMYFTDVNGVVTWQYPSEDYADKLFAKDDFTIQMWLFPETFSNSKIVKLGNDNALCMAPDGQLNFNIGTEVYPFKGITLKEDEYNHVVLTRSGNTLTCYVLNTEANNDQPVVQKATTSMVSGRLIMDGATQFELGYFKGAVDEFRLWTKCLSENEIVENYDHLLVGDEKNLETYWTFDEGLRTQFFDYSRDGTNYRKHHGIVGSNVQSSTLIATALKLKAKTDADGNYVIQGIPFTGEGTTYSVVPLYGIHEFNPAKTLLFVGKNSLVHTADFEDVSSFPMSGYIYYAGTNVPVEGVQLLVDGELQTKDGQPVQSDGNGRFNVSVPIGNHFVEAKLGGHTMVAGGRWPTAGTFYFDRPVQYDFADSTLVNFVGRVGGGLANDTLAVGFNLSHNNIGIATIQLALNNESFSLNCQDDHISDALTVRTWQSDTTSIGSQAYTGIDYEAKYITIRTDSLTGEFSALLPPLKYKVKSLRIDSNPDIDFGSLPEIDLTVISQEQTNEVTEILEDDTEQKRSYTYNTKMVKTYFAEPQLELIQMSVNGEGDAPKGVFGRKGFEEFSDDFGTTSIDNIWTFDDDGKLKYTYGYPVYDGGDRVKMRVWGYEVYVNRDPEPALPAVADTIALNGQVVTVSNEMSSEQMVVARVDNESLGLQPGDIYDLKQDQLILDTRGMNEFTFTTGLPNIAAPYTRQLSMEMERNNRTYTYGGVNAVVLGSLTTGTNFVTLGPDFVTMVLRDPPGATSKTTWKTGHTETKFRSSTQGFYGNEKFTAESAWGTSIETAAGLAVEVVTMKQSILTNNTLGFTYKVQRANQTDKTWTTTVTEAVTTGTKFPYVGSKGDVFVGLSTNIIVGDARKVGFFREGGGYPLRLDLRNSKTLGDSVRTTFMYTTYELEEVMIPKWKETRQSLMTFFPTKEEALNYVNTSDHCVYVTWLKPDDENLGTDTTTYRQLPPANWDGSFIQDSVLWCTDQINGWKDVMRDNEEDKVTAMNDPRYFIKNISFDGGNSHTYSNRLDTTFQKKHNYSHNLGGIVKLGGTSQTNIGGAVFNVVAMWDTENGWSMATSESDPEENYKDWAELEYAFSDGNKGTDFSVNIYKSPSGWGDIFSLLGGQSYNPYEGEEKTKYYYPGQYTLSNGTEQMENPNIRISIDGNADNSAKQVTLDDVPSGQAGQLTLHLTNLSSTTQGFEFGYDILVQEKANQMGLQILMDGVAADGRSVIIPAGETVKKIITVKQTDQSVLDYEDLEIRFQSQYQPIKIYDTVHFSVHFKPSSSPIDMSISEPVLNIETMKRTNGNLEMRLTNFDRQFHGMKKLGVEYRYEGSTSWTQPSELQFVVNEADTTKLGGKVLPATGDLRLSYDMSDANYYPQGNYTFRAYTMTMYGSDPVTVYSKEIAVVKDNQAPRQLTTPSPSSGILNYGDDMLVEFNEDIVPGYVSDKNVIVTGKLNNQPVQHEVALQLFPYGTSCMTANPVFLVGDFSLECWVKYTSGGVLLRQGSGEGLMKVSILNDGKVAFRFGTFTFTSEQSVPKDTWIFLAMSFNFNEMTFSMLAEYGTTSVMLFRDQEIGFSPEDVMYYPGNKYIYLGCGITGSIHDMAFYKIYRDPIEASAAKYQSKDNYVYGLTNYWPMNEGHGTIAVDTRHTHDFIVNDRWEINNVNYAMGLDLEEDEYVEADISRINTSRGDSYAIELWNLCFKQPCTVLETGTTAANKLRVRYDDSMNLWLDYGEKSHMVASHDDFPNHGTWHHLALNVVRGQAASFYYNGQRTAVIAEADIPSLQGARMKLGEGIYGRIDELRIWHATLTEHRLLSNMYNCIDTADVYSRGLVAYYPFEKTGLVDGVTTKVPTFENMAPGQSSMINGQSSMLSTLAPPLKNAPVESRLMAKPIASERKVVINLVEGSGIKARDIEGTTLNITVDGIHDMHGNESAPIRWTAYVQRNTLKWGKDSVTVIKQYGDDYYFDVTMVNKGGNTQYYTLHHLPEWLTLVDALNGSPVEITGDVAPLTTKTLRFKVMPTVPVGNYDITMGLQGNDGIMEPLRIVMKVRGETPDWTVNPDLYENAMSIVGQVYNKGILMSNSESLVAAFIDGQCRGVANIQPIRGSAFVTLSVYGTALQNVNGVVTDLDNGKPVTFRIWDASNGVVYTNGNITLPGSSQSSTVCTQIPFDDTKTYGDFNRPVIFSKSNLMDQELKLRQGWNWLSLNVEPVDTKTSVVFKDITSWNVYIKDRTTGTYFCNGTYWDGTLADMHANTMYKMQLTKLSKSKALPEPMAITGEQVKLPETKITLKKNWNWISYLPTKPMPLDMALAGANPQAGDQVKSQQGFAIYGPYGWDGNLAVMESGKGYLYYSVDNATKEFVYPTATSRAPLTLKALRREVEGEVFSPVDPETYSDNMSMVVKLVKGDDMVTDAELGAFVDDECRGVAVAAETSGLYYLLIAGEGHGNPMQLRVAVNGTVATVCTSVPFNSDAIVGTPWEPFVIDLDDPSGIHTIVASEADTEWYTLQGYKIGRRPTASGVYIHRGQKVTIIHNDK